MQRIVRGRYEEVASGNSASPRYSRWNCTLHTGVTTLCASARALISTNRTHASVLSLSCCTVFTLYEFKQPSDCILFSSVWFYLRICENTHKELVQRPRLVCLCNHPRLGPKQMHLFPVSADAACWHIRKCLALSLLLWESPANGINCTLHSVCIFNCSICVLTLIPPCGCLY